MLSRNSRKYGWSATMGAQLPRLDKAATDLVLTELDTALEARGADE